MSKLFYDHLLFFEEVITVVNTRKLIPKERERVLSLIDEIMHQHMLDEILTHLPKHHHETFLHHLTRAPHDKKLLEFLKKEARGDIEDMLSKRARKVKKELLVEIKKSK